MNTVNLYECAKSKIYIKRINLWKCQWENGKKKKNYRKEIIHSNLILSAIYTNFIIIYNHLYTCTWHVDLIKMYMNTQLTINDFKESLIPSSAWHQISFMWNCNYFCFCLYVFGEYHSYPPLRQSMGGGGRGKIKMVQNISNLMKFKPTFLGSSALCGDLSTTARILIRHGRSWAMRAGFWVYNWCWSAS